MNDNHTSNPSYRPRWIQPLLRSALQDYPVIVLSGARQVGKSTLLRHEKPFADWRYHTLDDFDVLDQIRRDPAALWAGTDRVVLDEVQKAPAVLPAIKHAVDQDRAGRRFVLSGSANLLLMQHVSETLAGRALYMPLYPMTAGEMTGAPPPVWFAELCAGRFPDDLPASMPPVDPFPLMTRGCMPSLLTLSTPAAQWWESYVMTYLERDLRQLSQIDNLVDFRNIMTMLALRSGAMLNQTDIARDVRVSQPTVHRYLNLLEAACLFERLPAFVRNRTKRLIKTPKAYVLDPGLAAFLSGHYTEESLRASREAGGMFETLIYLHLRALAQLQIPRLRLYYWRTTAGHEVDFIIEHGRILIAVETKLTARPGFTDARHLSLFLKEYPETTAGLLIHTGEQVSRLGDRIIAIPWTLLAGG